MLAGPGEVAEAPQQRSQPLARAGLDDGAEIALEAGQRLVDQALPPLALRPRLAGFDQARQPDGDLARELGERRRRQGGDQRFAVHGALDQRPPADPPLPRQQPRHPASARVLLGDRAQRRRLAVEGRVGVRRRGRT